MIACCFHAIDWWRALLLGHLALGLASRFGLPSPIIDAFDKTKCGFSKHRENWSKFEAPNKTDLSPRAIGGIPSHNGELPWVVTLHTRLDEIHAWTPECSGVIIHHNLILTAARCVTTRTRKNLWAVSNQYPAAQVEGRVFTVPDDIFVHPKYARVNLATDPSYDVAVVKLPYSFRYNDWLRPICMFDLDKAEPQGSDLCHFGSTSQDYVVAKELQRSVFAGLALPMQMTRPCKFARHTDQNCWDEDRKWAKFALSKPCDTDQGGPYACANGATSEQYYLTGIHLESTLEDCNDPYEHQENTNIAYNVRDNGPLISELLEQALRHRQLPNSRRQH